MKRQIGYVYAVEFEDGLIKVGRSRFSPGDRIKTHALVGQIRGTKPKRSIVSARTKNNIESENLLINLCSKIGTQAFGREWFYGVNFEQLNSIIGSISECSDQDVKAENAAVNASVQRVSDFFRPKSPVTNHEDGQRWSDALSRGQLLEAIFLGNTFSGPLFRPSGKSGLSNFALSASIAIYGMSLEECADLFCQSCDHPELMVGKIFKAARKTAKKIQVPA